ncbi:MAG: helical backbone metal receptor [Candidatus Sumerlaeaceae bacterium]|nr:helical backbone metal receptor [Candidatus Sumerlaeaceae bacterium]
MMPNSFRACAYRLCTGALFFLLLATASFAAAGDLPTTRILSLVPSHTEFLFAMGAGDMVIGVSDYCKQPPEAATRPHAGSLLNPNIERILSLRPDVVILLDSQKELADKLAKLNIASQLIPADSLRQVYEAIQTLGAACGRTTAAEQMVSNLKSQIAEVAQRASGKPGARVLVIQSRDAGSLQNLYVAGTDSFFNDLLIAAGATNAAPPGPHPSVVISKEQLAAADPDVIIDTTFTAGGEETSPTESQRRVWQQMPALKAVKSGRVYFITNPRLTVPGMALPETATKLEELIHR